MSQQQPAQPLPALTPEAYQVAVTYQLGRPTAEYSARFTKWKAIQVVFLLVVGLTAVVLAILSELIWAIILALIFFAYMIWSVVNTFLSRDKLVYVCTAGLLYSHRGKTEAIRWDQVEAFWQTTVRYRGVTPSCTIRRNDGATFKFNDQFFNVGALGNTIERETTRVLLPAAIAAYRAGQTLTFGRISLNQQGVSNGKEHLAWQQLKGMKIKQGSLFILKEDERRRWDSFQSKAEAALLLPGPEGNWRGWNYITASQIPNVSVLLSLVNSIISSEQR